jgi:hypothetical protein
VGTAIIKQSQTGSRIGFLDVEAPVSRGSLKLPCKTGAYKTGRPILRPASGHFMISRPTQQFTMRFPADPTLQAERLLL